MKLESAERHFRALEVGMSKKRYVGVFPITRSGRVQKIQKKEEKKILYGTFSFAVFLFPVIKGRKK